MFDIVKKYFFSIYHNLALFIIARINRNKDIKEEYPNYKSI